MKLMMCCTRVFQNVPGRVRLGAGEDKLDNLEDGDLREIIPGLRLFAKQVTGKAA